MNDSAKNRNNLMRGKDRQIALLSRLNGALAFPSSIIEVPVWKKGYFDLAGCTRVFSCQLVAVQWKKPISPVANGWLEVAVRGTGGTDWGKKRRTKPGKRGKRRKLTCDFLDSLTERAKGSKHTPI